MVVMVVGDHKLRRIVFASDNSVCQVPKLVRDIKRRLIFAVHAARRDEGHRGPRQLALVGSERHALSGYLRHANLLNI
jgi:hypothetical protein